MNLVQKIRQLAEQANETQAYSSILGMRTVPKERIPSINLANNITATTGDPNDTGWSGALTALGLTNLLSVAKILGTHIDPTLLTSLATVSYVNNKTYKTTQLDYVGKSMYIHAIYPNVSNKCIVRRQNGQYSNTNNNATVEYNSTGANITTGVSSTFGTSSAPQQSFGTIPVPTEIGKRYLVTIKLLQRSFYQTSNQIDVLTRRLTPATLPGSFTILIGTYGNHNWQFDATSDIGGFVGNNFSKSNLETMYEVAGSQNNQQVWYYGEMKDTISFVTPPATSTTTSFTFNAKLFQGWENCNPTAPSGYSYPIYSHSSELIMEDIQYVGYNSII